MGKAKKKKRKAIEKLWQKGNYWEWFKALEHDDLVNTYKTQWQDAWRVLVKRSFRLPERLEEFWENLDGIKKLPDFPDFRLLIQLRDFVNGKDVKKEVSAIDGLSIPAKAFRNRILSWQDGSASQKKLGSLLNIFVNHPEKITQKAYTNLAQSLDVSPISRPIETLGEVIGKARKLNYKSTVKKGGLSIRMRGLKELDLKVEKVSRKLPHSLQNILFYPFIYQINRLFDRLKDTDDMTIVARAVSSIPFLFSLTAGEKTEDIRDRLLPFAIEGIGENTLFSMAENLESADFEEKVAILGKMKPHIIGDFEDHFDIFRSLYLDVLSEIARRKEDLPPREKRELARVMEPVLFHDLDYLTEDINDLARILIKIAEAGCMERVLSVLSLIVAERVKNGRLKRHAESTLKGLPDLDESSISLALSRFEYVFIPNISVLKPLIDIFGDKSPFVSILADKLMKQVETHLLTASMAEEGYEFLSIFMDIAAKESRRELAVLRKELQTFREYEPFSTIQEYLDCFPEDKLTKKGFELFLLKVYKRTGNLDFLMEQMDIISKKISEAMDSFDEFLLRPSTYSIFEEQEEVCLLFLKKHANSIKDAQLEDIERWINFLFHKDSPDNIHLEALMQISNILDKRIASGEEEAEPLKERIIGFLIKSKRKKKGERKHKK